MTHDLKTLPHFWDAASRGEKRFEVRRDDRGFQKGDTVRLLRMDHQYYEELHTVQVDEYDRPTHVLEFRIGYILAGGQFGIEPGYVVMQLEGVLTERRCVVCGESQPQMGTYWFCHDHYRDFKWRPKEPPIHQHLGIDECGKETRCAVMFCSVYPEMVYEGYYYCWRHYPGQKWQWTGREK